MGNLYVNRNQIGAIVGSQPFGGEGLSGTGPKAGGPAYAPRFTAPARVEAPEVGSAALTIRDVQAAIDAIPVLADPIDAARLPGPTGERNVLRRHARGVALCLGPGAAEARAQAKAVRAAGGAALVVAPGLADGEGLEGVLAPADLRGLTGIGAVLRDGADDRAWRRVLAARDGPILPLLTAAEAGLATLERHTCTDTTAAGGNASLLMGGAT